MCTRTTHDPLVRAFLDNYNLHLLAVPRENVAVGDLYVDDGTRVSAPGSIRYFLDPPLEVQPISAREIMADITGKVSLDVSLKVGLGILGGFLNVLGAGEILNKIHMSYKAK